MTCDHRLGWRRFVCLAAVCAVPVLGLVSCHPASGLPAPSQPLTPTPDADFRSHAPDAEPRRLLRVPSLSSTVLPNGLKLIVAEDDDLPTVSIAFANPLARPAHRSLYALLGELTLATLLAAAKPIQDRDESAVVAFETAVGPRGTRLTLSGVADTLPQVGEHLRVVLLPPPLDSLAFSRAKATLSAGLATSHRVPSGMSRFAADVLYGSDENDQQLERAEERAKETLAQLSLEQVQDYYQKRYSPTRSALVFAGPVTLDQATAVVERELGAWRGHPQTAKPPTPRVATPGRRLRRFTSSTPDADRLVVALPCPATTSPDYLAFELLAQLLERVPSFELAHTLRQDSGIAYAWSAHCFDTIDERTFLVQVETAPGEAGLALEALLGVFEHLADGKLTIADLATARASFLADRAAALSSTRGSAQALADAFLNDLPDDFYETLEARVNQLTPAALQVTARRYLREAPMAIVVAGKQLAFGGRPLLQGISESP